jgi:two-component system, sensor histidine kinase YesM
MVTLSRRFSVAFILVVAVPSLLVSASLVRLYLSALHQTVAQQSEVTAEQVAQNIRNETDNVALLAAALLHDQQLRELAAAYDAASDPKVHYLAARRLDEKLVSFFNYTKQMGAVVVYLRSGAAYAYSNYPNIRGVGSIDRSVYAGAAADPGKVFLLDTFTAPTRNVGERSMISLAVCPAPGDETAVDAILLVFRAPYFDALEARWGDDAGSGVVVFGRSGKPILSSLPGSDGDEIGALASLAAAASASGAGSSAQEVRVAGRTWLATLTPMRSTGWTLALLADKAALSRRVTKYQWYLYPAVGLLTILFLVYAEVFFARVAGPIRAVVRHMGRVGKGDYAVRASAQPIAELAELSHGFNAMVEETERLLRERERSERERLSAELDALRYKINPHFVANTLNSIRLMAAAARAQGIAGMTRDLMRVLSDSYSGAERLAELSREIDNVIAYVGIMKVRFGERFAVEFALEPGTESLLTLRMILQPIVENSILHGFSGGASVAPARQERGTIRVGARLEARELPPAACPDPGVEVVPGQVLVVEVRDDGAGMEPDRAARLLEGQPEQGGLYRIGVSNVHRRIRLNYGVPYGLEVESQAGAFTRVRYVLPALVRSPQALPAHPEPVEGRAGGGEAVEAPRA